MLLHCDRTRRPARFKTPFVDLGPALGGVDGALAPADGPRHAAEMLVLGAGSTPPAPGLSLVTEITGSGRPRRGVAATLARRAARCGLLALLQRVSGAEIEPRSPPSRLRSWSG
jgi:hypothetical protein